MHQPVLDERMELLLSATDNSCVASLNAVLAYSLQPTKYDSSSNFLWELGQKMNKALLDIRKMYVTYY